MYAKIIGLHRSDWFYPIVGQYRPDIDGLRAIAVLAVILFHINKSLLPGGFVGVDIFFVISGFLITKNILEDIESGRFSIINFYQRRVRRIAPAMFAVLITTLIVAQFILLPEDAERVAQSANWAVLSLANVYFWIFQDQSYFANSNEQIPLLHLWSLGVEEQFYILWPLLLLAIFPFVRGRHFIAGALLLAFLSILLGEYLFEHDPLFTYYMLPTRAGELILGGLVATAVYKKIEQHLNESTVLAIWIIGGGLVISSIAFLSENGAFPGIRAVPPTLGAALLILSGHCGNSKAIRLLALKPLVWIGMISYSAYLWHWPLLAYYRYGNNHINWLAGLVIFSLTLFLAWLSWRYVEQPVRHMTYSAKRFIVSWYVVPTSVFLIIGLFAQYIDGYGIKFFDRNYRESVAEALRQRGPYSNSSYCLRWRINQNDINSNRCIIGGHSDQTTADVILWGDSNADHYIGMLSVFAKNSGFAFRNVGHSACPPVFTDPSPFLVKQTIIYWDDCKYSLELMRTVTLQHKVIIISSSWSDYQGRSTDYLSEVFKTVDTLVSQGKLVILVGKAPVFPNFDYKCFGKALRYPLLDCYETSVNSIMDLSISATNEKLRDFAEKTANVEYFDPTSYLCPGGSCSVFDPEGIPYYRNHSHISEDGSLRLGRFILERDGVPPAFSRIQAWLNSQDQR